MICLIVTFICILSWWSVWSLCSAISSMDDLFNLYYLGDKFELCGARNLIKEVVSSFKINQENWLDVLKGVKKYEDNYLFEDLCNILQDKIQGIGIYSIDKHWFYFADDKQVIFSNTRRGRIKKTLLSLKKFTWLKKYSISNVIFLQGYIFLRHIIPPPHPSSGLMLHLRPNWSNSWQYLVSHY